jgi:hypothetical protein
VLVEQVEPQQMEFQRLLLQTILFLDFLALAVRAVTLVVQEMQVKLVEMVDFVHMREVGVALLVVQD